MLKDSKSLNFPTPPFFGLPQLRIL